MLKRLGIVALITMAAVVPLATAATGDAQAATRHRHHHIDHYRKRHAVVRYVKRHVGAPYVWGAAGPWAFDCSGLMVAAYRSIGWHIPRTTYQQLRWLHYRRLRIGDLVFANPGHVGMYVGHGHVIESPHSGARVRWASIRRFRYAHRSVFR